MTEQFQSSGNEIWTDTGWKFSLHSGPPPLRTKVPIDKIADFMSRGQIMVDIISFPENLEQCSDQEIIERANQIWMGIRDEMSQLQ